MCYSTNNSFTKTAIKPLVYKVERNNILGNLVARKASNLADLYSKKHLRNYYELVLSNRFSSLYQPTCS